MNRHKRCLVCNLNHRPGNCKKTDEDPFQRIGPEGNGIGRFGPDGRSERLPSCSMVTLVADFSFLVTILSRIEEKLDRMMNEKMEIPVGGDAR